MRIPVTSLATLTLTLVLGASAAMGDAKPGNAGRGRQIFMATGCYQCHGTTGEGGGNAGPRLAPQPIPFQALLVQLRHPRAKMPVYTALVMPDSDVADIYAYLQSVPKGKSADDIALLKGLASSPESKSSPDSKSSPGSK